MKIPSIKLNNKRLWTATIAVCCIGPILISTSSLTSAGEVNTGYFGKVAIMGYDTVAYFKQKKAMRGSKKYSHKWLGATWLFASDDHRKAFAASPIKFAPQYGGLCTVGVAYGEVTREIDPEAWSIIKGKLYLNYAKSVTSEFEKNSDKIIAEAEKKWAQVRKDLVANR